MRERHHETGDTRSTAVYSDCGRYRYSLTRGWAPTGRILFLMLNPSTATELRNDPTVERCERRARTLRYGGFRVANLFAFRATDPRELRTQVDPIGPDNDQAIDEAVRWSATVVCAWGADGRYLDRAATVAERLRALGAGLFHLGLTRTGQPRHPLYVPYARRPTPWS